jgi:pyrroline-5-carboxylate reductase
VTGVTRLAIVGGGRMGEAIAAGLIRAGILAPSQIVIAEPDAGKRDRLVAFLGIGAAAGGAEALCGADAVVLAVKPQVIDVVLSSLAPYVGDALVLSIAAGVTPALVGAGMSIVSAGTVAGAQDVATAEALFGALGDVIVLPEGLQDACTAISGCGPAYMALFVDALACAGVTEGLSREVAERLALQTMRGTVELIQTTGQSPAEVIDAVSSPGGATIAAVAQLESRGVRDAIAAAVRAAAARSQELGR